jgi:glycosyltransferase involved in cell wall biosynthesis
MDISIVVPLFNEEESLPELVEWIARVIEPMSLSFEIVLVDDGSTDDSWNVIQKLSESFPQIVALRFRRNYGKSAGLSEGFSCVKGNVVITMDADLQDSPDEIPELYRMISEEKYDLVSGWKKKRYDPLTKTIPTKLFNAATRRVSGIKLHDFNCGLKAYKRQTAQSLEIYGERHRYLPVLAKWNGYKKIGEKVVQHRARKYGVTKFGWQRFINGFLDLLSLTFVGKFATRPMHFLGGLGILFFLSGLVILAYLTAQKIIFDQCGIDERPLFFFGILTLIIGTQLFVTGFISELIVRNAIQNHRYQIAERINAD